jgi:hypothetical protein
MMSQDNFKTLRIDGISITGPDPSRDMRSHADRMLGTRRGILNTKRAITNMARNLGYREIIFAGDHKDDNGQVTKSVAFRRKLR